MWRAAGSTFVRCTRARPESAPTASMACGTAAARAVMSSLAPVSVGTALARELYALKDLRVVNIAIGDPAADAPAIVTRG